MGHTTLPSSPVKLSKLLKLKQATEVEVFVCRFPNVMKANGTENKV